MVDARKIRVRKSVDSHVRRSKGAAAIGSHDVLNDADIALHS